MTCLTVQSLLVGDGFREVMMKVMGGKVPWCTSQTGIHLLVSMSMSPNEQGNQPWHILS